MNESRTVLLFVFDVTFIVLSVTIWMRQNFSHLFAGCFSAFLCLLWSRAVFRLFQPCLLSSFTDQTRSNTLTISFSQTLFCLSVLKGRSLVRSVWMRPRCLCESVLTWHPPGFEAWNSIWIPSLSLFYLEEVYPFDSPLWCHSPILFVQAYSFIPTLTRVYSVENSFLGENN